MVKTGKWYRTSEGRELQVIQIDADEGIVEVEYSDGDLEALDLDLLISETELYPISSPATEDESLQDYVFDYASGDDDGGRHTLYEVLDSMQY